jgi:hypothetical protein
VVSDAVRWLEEEFDSHRTQNGDYEPPQTDLYGFIRPMVEFCDAGETCCLFCRDGNPEKCLWQTDQHPQPDASRMLLGLPWGETQEQAWLRSCGRHDYASLERLASYGTQKGT